MFLVIGLILGVMTYLSWMGFYWLYLPKSTRHWFGKSMSRLFFIDAALTVIGIIVFSSISSSLTAVIAACTLGLLGTVTTIVIRACQRIKSSTKSS